MLFFASYIAVLTSHIAVYAGIIAFFSQKALLLFASIITVFRLEHCCLSQHLFALNILFFAGKCNCLHWKLQISAGNFYDICLENCWYLLEILILSDANINDFCLDHCWILLATLLFSAEKIIVFHREHCFFFAVIIAVFCWEHNRFPLATLLYSAGKLLLLAGDYAVSAGNIAVFRWKHSFFSQAILLFSLETLLFSKLTLLFFAGNVAVARWKIAVFAGNITVFSLETTAFCLNYCKCLLGILQIFAAKIVDLRWRYCICPLRSWMISGGNIF